MADTSLLVIDDDPAVHDLIDYEFEGAVDRIFHAVLPNQGLCMAIEENPTVILLDIEMPQTDGFEVCRQLKNTDRTRDIPVVFLTCANSPWHVAKGLDLGGMDYVTKPFKKVELLARVRNAIRLHRLIDLLREHGLVDAVTGLRNRAAFDEALATAIVRHTRQAEPFALLRLDLDNFKSLNDTHGHGVGDEVLRRVGTVITQNCRPYDTAARFGGEEFLMILSSTDQDEARQIAERLLTAIRALGIPAGERVLRITCSIGLIGCAEGGTDLDAKMLLTKVNSALHMAKQQGRDRLVVHAATQATVVPRRQNVR